MILKYIFTLIGLVKLPEPHEKAVLLKFIKENYGNLSPNELKIAFELSLQNDSNDDLKHFQTFSVLYLSKVVKSYLEHRKKVVKVLMKEKANESHKQLPMSEEDVKRSHRFVDKDILLNAFIRYCKTGVLDFSGYPVGLLYEDLEERHGFINVTTEEKKAMFIAHTSKVERKIEEDSKQQSTNRKEFDWKKQMKEMLEGKHDRKKKQMIQDSCRRQLIKELFEDWKEEGTDVEQILKLK